MTTRPRSTADAFAHKSAHYLVAPAFWSFSRPLLRADAAQESTANQLVHLLPTAASPWIPADIALPLAFAVGSAYLLALARDLFRLRHQREQFDREIRLLGGIFLIAMAVAGMGLFEEQLPDKLFHELYAIAIGLAFLLVQIALGLRPQLAEEVTESAKAAYANSTLTRIDRDAAIARLAELMGNKRVYADSDLSLATLASRLDLSSHQLSELLNVHLGKGFSRYLREQRVAAARSMLVAEPAASVLSVGLSVGFSTQSTFYEAFREIEGMTPGQYRKLQVDTKARR